jgi:hypothetical protein
MTMRGLAIGCSAAALGTVILLVGVLVAFRLSFQGELGSGSRGGNAGDDPQVTPGMPLLHHIEIKDEAGDARLTVTWRIEAHPRFAGEPGRLRLVSLVTGDGTALPIPAPQYGEINLYTSDEWSFACGPSEMCVRRFVATFEVSGRQPFRSYIGVWASIENDSQSPKDWHRLTVTTHF